MVNDLPGFVSNRVSHIFMNEAVWVVQDQVAEPEKVDDSYQDTKFRACPLLRTMVYAGLLGIKSKKG